MTGCTRWKVRSMTVPRKIPDAFRAAARRADAAGWTITYRGSGHLAWKPPSGRMVFTPATPSDPRGMRNALAKLRRAGLPR
jgi:hypothetical protein